MGIIDLRPAQHSRAAKMYPLRDSVVATVSVVKTRSASRPTITRTGFDLLSFQYILAGVGVLLRARASWSIGNLEKACHKPARIRKLFTVKTR
jgi:hypothetical protein